MIAFDESAIFPPTGLMYDYGGSLGPGMDTTVSTKDSGYVTTYPHYAAGRRKYQNIDFTTITLSQVAQLKSFYWCRSGSAMGFRFLDVVDYSSAADGTSPPTATDQLVKQDTNGNWRLAKQYAGGLISRWILKPFTGDIQIGAGVAPVTSSVLLADGGSIVAAGSYAVDTTTGIVTGYLPSGTLTAGYYFHTPARFDGTMKFVMDDFQIGSVSDIDLQELLYQL